jgi:two-component system CheB/CheR fusion protein
MEAEQRAGNERFRLLIESAVDYAIFTMDARGRIDSWNRGAERMFGYTASEAIGEDPAMLFTPEDRAAGVPEQELITAAETGRAEDERWHIRKSGERFFASGVMTRLAQDGRARGFAKIARDLTERRQNYLAVERAKAELEDRVGERTATLQAEVARRTGRPG